VPAMTERVLDLAVAIAPELVVERLPNLGAGRDRLGERGVGIGDLESEHDRRTTDRGRREDAEFRELVGDVEHDVANAELNAHQLAVGHRDAGDLVGAERLPVEGRGASGALDDDVRCDGHACTVWHARLGRSSCAVRVSDPDPTWLDEERPAESTRGYQDIDDRDGD